MALARGALLATACAGAGRLAARDAPSAGPRAAAGAAALSRRLLAGLGRAAGALPEPSGGSGAVLVPRWSPTPPLGWRGLAAAARRPAEEDAAPDRPRLNRAIKAPTLRLVTDAGSHEILERAVALLRAKEAGLDLVEVNAKADPPVCRLLDYEKVLYAQRVREKENRKKELEQRRAGTVKNMRLGVRTDEHDLANKVATSEKHLEQGYMVRVMIQFKPSDASTPKDRFTIGQKTMERVVERLAHAAKVESPPKMAGPNNMTMLLTSIQRGRKGKQ